jgi:hypothetical protein
VLAAAARRLRTVWFESAARKTAGAGGT